jgi:hypothetical protein
MWWCPHSYSIFYLLIIIVSVRPKHTSTFGTPTNERGGYAITNTVHTHYSTTITTIYYELLVLCPCGTLPKRSVELMPPNLTDAIPFHSIQPLALAFYSTQLAQIMHPQYFAYCSRTLLTVGSLWKAHTERNRNRFSFARDKRQTPS